MTLTLWSAVGRVQQGVDLDVSMLADWIGAAAVVVKPIVDAVPKRLAYHPAIHLHELLPWNWKGLRCDSR